MRIIKLPHLPSDTKDVRQGDYLPDVWKGKEIKVKQNQVEQHIKMKNIVIFGAPGSGKGTQSDKLIAAKVYDSFGRAHKGVIFDGFPRTIPQAEALKQMLSERGDKVAAMLELDVPEEELMKRLLLRGQQSGRADDNEETIKKRLVVYHSQTMPLIEWYKKEGLHHHIDGLGDLDRIFKDIQEVIDNI